VAVALAGCVPGTRPRFSTGLDRGFEFARVANHVGIGEIHDDCVEVALLDGLHDLSAMPAALISGFRSYWALSATALGCASSPPNGFLDAAVEEIRDVGVLLGFRAAEIFQICRQDLREDVRNLFGCKHIAQHGQALSYCVHRDKQRFFGLFASANSLNPGLAMARSSGGRGSARKLKKITASSSRIGPRRGGGRGAPGDHNRIDKLIRDVPFVAAAGRPQQESVVLTENRRERRRDKRARRAPSDCRGSMA